MGIATKYLKQDVTHWTVGESSYDGYTFGPPTLLAGRWEQRRELFRNSRGEEETSNAVVYLDTDVDVGDYIVLGDYTSTVDPSTLEEAHRVRRFDKMPDLWNIQVVRTAMI